VNQALRRVRNKGQVVPPKVVANTNAPIFFWYNIYETKHDIYCIVAVGNIDLFVCKRAATKRRISGEGQ
jgi:hypothetical protein